MEVERKFLFDELPTFLEPEDENIARINVKQIYLSIDPEIRIRRKFILYKDGTSKNEYFKTQKSDGNLVREEIEAPITRSMYIKLCNFAYSTMGRNEIDKDYYRYKLNDNLILECSIVDRDLDTSFIYGEVEFESEEEANNFVVPDYFGQEVTYDKDYKMKNYFARTRKKVIESK